jgi:hypothetical protein
MAILQCLVAHALFANGSTSLSEATSDFSEIDSTVTTHAQNRMSYSIGGQTVDSGQLFGRARPFFFKITYLKHN